MSIKGHFQLIEPHDLLRKLEHDFARIEADRSHPYPAFDFFVTAEHMLDWVYPGKVHEPHRRAARDANWLLQVVSHLATGAKHMVPEAKHHTSVAGVDGARVSLDVGSRSEEPLVVVLDESARVASGIEKITVLGLAHRVLAFWTAQLRDPSPAV